MLSKIKKLCQKQQAHIRIGLLHLALIVLIGSSLLTFGSVLYASYQVQRAQLIEASLDSNYNYAKKLAVSTDDFLVSAQKQVAMAAYFAAKFYDDPALLEQEADRLRQQTDSFNSVVIINKEAVVLAASPEALNLVGEVSIASGIDEALLLRQPYISAPTLSTAGNFMIFISHPIVSEDGEYLGVVSGSLYLRQTSILNRLLGNHYYSDGSYLYVVTKDKQLIYHPTETRVGEVVDENWVVDDVALVNSGKGVVISQEIEMLAGYATVPTTGWGIVAQRPLSAAVAPLENLMYQVIQKTLPLAFLILLLGWFGARIIAKPLRSLAERARSMDVPETRAEIQQVRSWYFEAHELKKAMLVGMGQIKKNIDKLNKDVRTDPLTGLHNRRSLTAELLYYESHQMDFSVISIDIDHFKKVNDTYGHDVGDAVLKELALLIQESSRDTDLPCRLGGEEFILILPRVTQHDAAQIAERLRQRVERTRLPDVGHITVSIGIANWPSDAVNVTAVLKLADDMLYKAKREGRNRVEAYTPYS